MNFKKISFYRFAQEYRDYYKLKDVYIKNISEAQDVMYDLYGTDLFEFDYDKETIELYYK